MGPRVLVVANETLGGRNLIEAVETRASRGDDPDFVVIAPQNRPKAGAVIYDEAVRSAAEHRVQATLDALAEAGVHATGEVMDPDPFTAVMDAIEEFDAEEVIISTHPATRSGWLRRDLIERVRQASGLPVDHVVVDVDDQREDVTHTLVVANQTVEGSKLFDLLRERASDHRFTVVVPQAGGLGHHAQAARERLRHMLEHMREEGIEASGGIGHPDPFNAITNATQFYRVDEIVISTLPEGESKWLKSGLIDKVRRSTAIPVEHVVQERPAGVEAQ